MVAKGEYRTFDEAGEFAQKLGLRSAREWRKFVLSGSKPDDVPANPQSVYKIKWKGFEDWVGYIAKRSRYSEFLSFEEAVDFVRRLNLRGAADWRRYCESGKKPKNIPANPNQAYKDEWKGTRYWVGTHKSGYGKFRSFEDARKYVQELKLGGMLAWHSYCKSGKRPNDIPTHPEKTYRKEWKGWSDWTGFYPQRKKFGNLRSYEESKKFVHALGLKDTEEWNEWKKSGRKPSDIPASPNLVYKNEWMGMGDWLGTNKITNFKRVFRPFGEAREFVRKLNFKSQKEWKQWSKSGKRPLDIPAHPFVVYKNEWKDMSDWLGVPIVANQNKQFKSFKDAREYVRKLGLKNAVEWLERLEKGEISTVTRRDLNVQLSQIQVEQRIKKYGDFERFNQRINTEKSETTHIRFIENPEEWVEYHRQYREARQTWIVIPYEHRIKRLKELSPRLEVGDFGCGEAKLQEAVGDRVHSFDHVAISENITACDMKSVPLDDGSLDVVIFSLSLMGKNWVEYIREAKRCLATNGFLFISETTNALKVRLSSMNEVLSENGFEIYDDYENDNFTFIEARKI